MNVVDLPRPGAPEKYDEAISRYTELVQSRAIALYRVGDTRYPGLSGVEVLVVTDRCSLDNSHFYSAAQRLPRRYLQMFVHEPYILPAWSLRVMRHTAHSAPVLLAGRDVLEGFPPSDEPAERWCRMLEGYCSSARFIARVKESGTLKGRLAAAVASRFRYTLAEAESVIPEINAEEYRSDIDVLSARFFEREDHYAAVNEFWTRFTRGFETLDSALRGRLESHGAEDAFSKARTALRGDVETALFDREYAFRRAQAIDGYHKDLASMGFPYGHLFFIAAHPGAVHAKSASAVSEVVRNLYRVRRRLEEYVGA